MRLHKIIFAAATSLVLCSALLASCEKQAVGFLSDRIYYLQNPYYQQQGINSVSSSLIVDGSTPPLYASIVSIINASTGKSADSMFLQPRTISTYKGVVSSLDSTLEMLKAKLQDSLVAPFNINPIGGRLQFTAASLFIDSGSYNLSIHVKNERAERTISNACLLVINPVSSPDTVLYRAWTIVDASGVANAIADPPSTDVTRASQGPAKIMFKWKDKNGALFNPAAGQVIKRTGRPTFKDWDPYYAEIKTDTSIEYEYPAGIPRMPAYLSVPLKEDGSTWNDGICYYRVTNASTVSGMGINTVSTIQYNVTQGTYTITYNLFNVEKKP